MSGLQNLIHRFVFKGKSFFRTFAQRILVHLVSLLVAFKLESSLRPLFLSEGIYGTSCFFYLYIGLICLFPQGNPRRTDWFIPVISGFILMTIQIVLGAPWQLAIFWGGAQTWLLRLLTLKSELRWEWSVSPFLLISAVFFIESLSTVYPILPALVSLGLVSGLAYLFYILLNKYHLSPQRKEILINESKRLESFLLTKLIPSALEEPLKNLAGNAKLLSRALNRLDDSTLAPIMSLSIITNRVSLLVASDDPRWSIEGERILKTVARLNDDFAHRLRGFDIASLDEEEKLDETDPRKESVDKFYKMATELARKKNRMPEHLRPILDNLRLSSRKILDAMRKDPYAYESGERFLRRYLSSAHTVIDNYINYLDDHGLELAEKDEIMQQTEELLRRLESAFAKEYAAQLQNETMDYKADLEALDALLKLDGR